MRETETAAPNRKPISIVCEYLTKIYAYSLDYTATAVILLTEKFAKWRPLPLVLVLGGTRNYTPQISFASIKTSTLNPLRGSTPTAAALRRAVRCMEEARQSPCDPRLPIGGKPWSNPRQGDGMRRASDAKVSSTERVSSATPCEGYRPSNSLLSRSEWLDHAEAASTRFMVVSGGILSEGYGPGGSGVCLGDGQTEACLEDMGVTGLASAWAMARRRPK